MGDLPLGTVTFLFTDLEGSTRMWEDTPSAMREALARHDVLVEQAIANHRGVVFSRMGDGMAAAFASAPQAIAAAVDAQRDLCSEPWGATGPLRVRMALHTGDGVLIGEQYANQPLNRCARLMAAGHGGQVLVSAATEALIRDVVPEDLRLVDLGEHRLRDLARPMRVFQATHSELPSGFPPLRSLEALPNNLPVQLTSFIGHEQEISELRGLLDANRLVTLTGAAGCGKTRLAVQVGAELLDTYADGVWLVDLAPLADPDLLTQEVATTLGVREAGRSTVIDALDGGAPSARSLVEVVADHLRSMELLLVLDNCEHLLDAAAGLAGAVLRRAPNVRILATSREALGVAGEASWRVRSLSVPDPEHRLALEALASYEAIQLFVDRARARLGVFELTSEDAPAVAQVCRRLDGIPLAIELAAARVEVLSPRELASRLDDRFRLLTGGTRTGLERHQTLRAAVDWSYDALSEPERALLERLSVFAGGCTLEAAEEVCIGGTVEQESILDLITQLVAKSLLIADRRGHDARYRLLETIRQYGREKLVASGQSEELRGRHLHWCLALGARAERGVWGAEQAAWFDVLEAEEDNFRQALDWTIATGEAESALRLVGALSRFWMERGRHKEGRRWLLDALALDATGYPYLRAQALTTAAMIVGFGQQQDVAKARALASEALALFRELGIRRGIFWSLHTLAAVTFSEGDLEEATSLADETLEVARSAEHEQSIAYALLLRGMVHVGTADYSSAEALLAEALPTFRRVDDKTGLASLLMMRGHAEVAHNRYSSAVQFYQESLAISRQLGSEARVCFTLFNLGAVAVVTGDHDSARQHFEEILEISSNADNEIPSVPLALIGMGELALVNDDAARAAAQSSEAMRRCTPAFLSGPYSQLGPLLAGSAKAAAMAGSFTRAAQLFGAAQQTYEARRSMGVGIHPTIWLLYDHLYEQQLERVRSALGDRAFAAEVEEGRAMSLQAAVDYSTSGRAGV